ncbi:MAG TPA: aldo/keto reductase [Acidimicrobiales bacterium]|jgi:aryl-alcohol dehydrogenase-like predicted oxidoreductase|nr:aldo/keto reductase [Acidimicrobiales bacterium]
MEYRYLGRTGMQVSTFCLGTMMFGSWGNPDPEACAAMVDLAIDAGVNFFDTADVYDAGHSEELLGRALGSRRSEVVIATKFHYSIGEGPNLSGNSRRWINIAVEESLRRLGTDWIDLYQVHRPDPTVEIGETLDALSDLVHAGKIRAFGTSTFPSDELVDAQWTAKVRHSLRPMTEQPPYSIFTRGIEADVLPACLHHQIGVLVWSPLNGGWLTGKYRRGEPAPAGSRGAYASEHFDYGGSLHDRKIDLVERLEEVAESAGCSMTALALAFATEHPAIDAAIIGPKSVEQLTDLLSSADFHLDASTLDAIDGIVPPGIDVNPHDGGYVRPELTVAARRR